MHTIRLVTDHSSHQGVETTPCW